MTPPTETASETASETALETASQPTDTVIAVTEEAGTSTASATPEIEVATATSTSQPAYVIAILPITIPLLAESSDPGAVLPAGGIPFPDMNDPDADFQGYYQSITGLLDATPSDTFVPSILQLDALIQSMMVKP